VVGKAAGLTSSAERKFQIFDRPNSLSQRATTVDLMPGREQDLSSGYSKSAEGRGSGAYDLRNSANFSKHPDEESFQSWLGLPASAGPSDIAWPRKEGESKPKSRRRRVDNSPPPAASGPQAV
jgi:hypothetical protein